MQAYNTQTGIVCPLDRANVDTDQIIAKQFLKSIKRTGFGVNLFDDWRYLDEGYPGQDNSTRIINPDFVLNQPRYQGASILLARRNFGCGSSREHAPWALSEYGFRWYFYRIFGRIDTWYIDQHPRIDRFMSVWGNNKRFIYLYNFTVISTHTGNIHFTSNRMDFTCPLLSTFCLIYFLIAS